MFSHDLEQKNSGGFIQTAATVLAVIISALASYQFFATYSGALLAGLVPAQFLSVAAGLLGVVMLELATLYWQYSIQHDSDSQAQLAIARSGYTVSLVASVTVTALYFLLTSSLVAPYVAQVQHLINAFAALVLVGIVSFQFVAKVQYSHVATKASQAQQEAQLRALHNSAEFSIKEASTRSDLENALAALQEALPAASKKRGADGAKSFIAARYGNGVNHPNQASR